VRREAVLRIAGVVALAAATACWTDPNERCGPHQVFDEGTLRCACAPGFRVDVVHGTCLACGEHEVANGTVCQCEPGFDRFGAGGTCVAVPAGLGAPCGAGLACAVAPFTACRAEAAGSYCTVGGCASAADCPAGFTCDATTSPSTCRRPPTGQGASCLRQDDCVGYAASYCEDVTYKQCVVPKCDLVTGGGCTAGWKCCDLRPTGVAETVCLPEAVTCPRW
jgi:hypothetical protein